MRIRKTDAFFVFIRPNVLFLPICIVRGLCGPLLAECGVHLLVLDMTKHVM